MYRLVEITMVNNETDRGILLMNIFNSKALKDKLKRFELGKEYIRQNKKIEN